MFTIHALEAREALTKSLSLDESGLVSKSNYPPVKDFTSHDFEVSDLVTFFKCIEETASKGWCLLKGKLNKTLNNEPRAGSTNSDDMTHWMCLDIDGLTGFKSVADFMDQHHDLNDISYVVQYSSSSGLPNVRGLHAHVFIMLSHAHYATYLKGWLIKQNVDGTMFESKIKNQLSLNRTQSVLRYPIDITACQNDKLLYVAPPVIGKGVKFSKPHGGFIQLVKKKYDFLPIERIKTDSVEKWKTEARNRYNSLRKEAGLDVVKGKPKLMDGFHVEPECGEFHITGMREDRGFVYFNMNNGDSWSWYHPVGHYKYIHCFKDDRVYLTKNILPNYFKSCETARKNPTREPTDDILLAFRDIRSAAYFNGTWNPVTRQLDLHQAKSEVQLDHFLQQHGRQEGIIDFIPQWNMGFYPQNPVICDPDAMFLNTYVPSPFFSLERTPSRNMDACPTIRRIILSAVSGNVWSDVTEHYLNWLAVIVQHKVKTRTAWVLHGVEGTGKGILANLIITPILGARYVQQRRMSELEEKYTGWLEEALIAIIDEVQVSSSQRKSIITGDLKNFITEPRCTIRHMQRMAYLAESYTNFMLFSNMDDPVMINEHDRRFNIGEYQTKKIPFNSKDKAAIHLELPAFMDYIMQREADIDHAGEIIKNEAHKSMVTANRNSLDMLSDALNDGDMSPFVDALPDTKMLIDVAGTSSAVGVQYSHIILRELSLLTTQTATEEDGFFHAKSRLTRDELWILFEHCIGNISRSPHKFTKLLKHKHIETAKLRINDKPQMGFEVEWVASRDWVDANRMPIPNNVTKLKKAS